MTKWNRVRWAKHNIEIGLSYSEICPGLTVGEHADSMAMFLIKDKNYSDIEHTFARAIVSDRLVRDLYEKGYENPHGE